MLDAVSLVVATTLTFHPYAMPDSTAPTEPRATTVPASPTTAKIADPPPTTTAIEPRVAADTHAVTRPKTRSGIGLAVVRDLVALHGGSVRADDAPGGGARFVVELPHAQRAGAQADTAIAGSQVPA